MKKKEQVQKLKLSKETLKNLESGVLEKLQGGICRTTEISCPTLYSNCC